jgi:hypothetical protein
MDEAPTTVVLIPGCGRRRVAGDLVAASLRSRFAVQFLPTGDLWRGHLEWIFFAPVASFGRSQAKQPLCRSAVVSTFASQLVCECGLEAVSGVFLEQNCIRRNLAAFVRASMMWLLSYRGDWNIDDLT